MAATYQLISSVTVGSGGASSIDFTSIPATYTDLLISLSIRSTNNGWVDGNVLFNSSTSNFTWRSVYGTGASAVSGTNTTNNMLGQINGSNTTASTFANILLYVPNYAGNSNKSFSIDYASENNATTSYAGLVAGLWSNTAAITAVGFTLSAGNFAQYSTAYLYGIKNS